MAPGPGAGSASATLRGRVTYRARVALPAGAVVEVRLLDVSRADAAATELARSVVTTRGEQVPVPFALAYDPGVIDGRGRYVIEATITVGSRVAWRTTAAQRVLTGGAPAGEVEIVVQQLR
jgi:putative lipoprotein